MPRPCSVKPGNDRWAWLLRCVLLAVLVLGWEPVRAQSAPSESAQFQARTEEAAKALASFQARIEEAAKALASYPPLKNVSDQKRQQLTEFVVANMLFAFVHEMTHAVIHEMELPVLGREEDAADAYTILSMLKIGTTMTHQVLVEASKAWFLMDKRNQREGTQPDAWDAHGLDEQRAYQIVCLMVGSGKEQFKDLANETNLPEERQETGQDDYKRVSWSWEKALKSSRRSPEQPRQQIEVTYWPGKGEFDIYERTFRSIRILETVANYEAETYAWPHPLGLEMATCGKSAAQWQSYNRKVFLCYELAQEFGQLYRDYGQDWKAPPTEKWWKWWKRFEKK